MSFLSGIFVYFLIWWVVIFCTLPFGIRNIESPKDGSMPGAPVHAGLGKKIIATTIISIVVWGIIELIILYGGISFREMAARMSI